MSKYMSLEQTIRKLGAKGVSQPLEKDMNDQVHAGGYTSKHFEVSAPAQKLFASLPKDVDSDKAEKSVQLHDKLFAIHKKTMASERSTSADMKAAQELHDQIMSLAKEMGLENKHGHVKDSLDFIKQKFDDEGNVKDDVSSDDVAKRYASPPKDYQSDVKNDADIDNISKFRISRDKRAQRKLKIIDDQYNPGVNKMDRIEKVSPSFLEALKKVQENALELAEKKKMTKADIAALKHPKGKIDANDLAALRAGEHKKKVEEETLDEAQFIVIQKGMDKKRIRNNPYEIMRARKEGWAIQEESEQIDELKKTALMAVRNRAAGRMMDSDLKDEKATKVEKQASDRLKKIKDKEDDERSKREYKEYKEEAEQVDEVLDTPGKKLGYAVKHNVSHMKAKLTGDDETSAKRERGAKLFGKKMEKDKEKREMDSYRNKLAGKALRDMGSKTGFGSTYNKIFKEDAEQVDEVVGLALGTLAGIGLSAAGMKTGVIPKAVDKASAALKKLTKKKPVKEDAEDLEEGSEMQNLAKSQKSAIVKREVQQKKAMFAKKDSMDKAKHAKAMSDVKKEEFIAKAIAILGEEFAGWSFEELAEAIVAKKPRGRPRKNPPKDPNAPKKPRGRPRKDAGAAEKKPEDTDKDREHIVMGLRKAISLRGQHGVKFADGSTHQISAEHAQKALKIHDSLSKPSEKMVYQRKLAASHASFKKALEDKNPGGEETKKTGITLAKRAEF